MWQGILFFRTPCIKFFTHKTKKISHLFYIVYSTFKVLSQILVIRDNPITVCLIFVTTLLTWIISSDFRLKIPFDTVNLALRGKNVSRFLAKSAKVNFSEIFQNSSSAKVYSREIKKISLQSQNFLPLR